jgi:predicted glycoside hydrolase/deacetylase ChbG (UPF0249 family)
VNADDLGQSIAINKGIVMAYEQGIVTSASLMVRYEAANDAAEYAGNNPTLGVGLHVDLGEWVCTDGNWSALYEVVSLEDVKAVEREINDQVESFYKIMKRKPTHIDSHQHVHHREVLRPVFLELAQKLNVTLRGCSNIVKYCGDFYGQSSDGFPFHEAISVKGLAKTIDKTSNGITELACHPGLNSDATTMYGIERQMEVATLCDKSIRLKLLDAGIELCSFEGIPFQ